MPFTLSKAEGAVHVTVAPFLSASVDFVKDVGQLDITGYIESNVCQTE